MYYVYILKSTVANRFYAGVTKDLEKRLINHNKGGTKSIKPFRPWRIAYIEKYIDKKQAFKREFYLKSPKGYLEKKLITAKL
jgi:putative endonuclease